MICEMRCKLCLTVVRYPGEKSKIERLCGICRGAHRRKDTDSTS